LPTAPAAETPNKLSALALLASLTGVVVEILTNISKIGDQLDQHFFITLSVLWAAAVIFSFTTSLGDARQTMVRRYLIIGGVSLLATASMGWKYWQYYEHNRRITRPAEPPKIKLTSLVHVPVVLAAESPLHLTFFLNEDLSSFHLTNDHKFGQGPVVPSYVANPDIIQAFHSGGCTGVEGDRPAQAAVPVLRDFWMKKGRTDLAGYLQKPDSLGRLIRERGDIFAQIIPTSAEFKSMPPADYEILRAWIHDCVGLYLPVFTFAFANESDQDVTLAKIVYHVHEIGTVKGGTAGPLVPLKTYDFTLAWRTGDQIQNIAFVIPAHQQASFDVRLSPDSLERGITWWMNIEVVDSKSASVKTSDFQLTMNKER
jgi:hypothetical protein